MPASVTLQPARGSSIHSVDTRSLARMTMAELDQLFAELDVASVAELQGSKRGRVLAVAGLDWAPGLVRRAVLGLINQLPIWQGETFEGEFGANTWLLPGHPLQFGRFLVREARATDGAGEVIRFDYDVAANPAPLRRIVSELRHLGPGLFLARTQVIWRGRVVEVSYFTLAA